MQFSATIDPDTRRRLVAEAERTGESYGEILDRLVGGHCRKVGDE